MKQEIRTFMNIVESAAPDTIGLITVNGRVGGAVTFVEEQLRNQVPGDGDYGWKAERKLKAKWQSINISPLRIGKASVGIDNASTMGRISGQIFFFEKDRAQAMEMIKSHTRDLLAEEITKLNATIASIG